VTQDYSSVADAITATQTPDCGYTARLTPRYATSPGGPTVAFDDPAFPIEAEWDAAAQVFTFGKCDDVNVPPTTTLGEPDAECATVAATTPIEIILAVTLVDEPRGLESTALSFSIVIGNDCENDVINSLTISGSDIATPANAAELTYYLSSTAVPSSATLEVAHSVAYCPITCEITQTTGTNPSTSLAWATGEYDTSKVNYTPSSKGLTFSSSDKSLHGETDEFSVTCVSDLSI
jgi:hypothetical protein